MSREIRKVPANWKHPKGMMPYGYDYLPMYDENFEDALKEYKANKRLWNKKQHPDQLSGIATDSTFIDWFGEEPNPAHYRPYKDEERRNAGDPSFCYTPGIGRLAGRKWRMPRNKIRAEVFSSSCPQLLQGSMGPFNDAGA
jgi:hypothetical protein